MPVPAPGQVLVRVAACAVCRTDLHVVDGELPHPKLPIVPGHEIVGRVVELGAGVERFAVGDRVGVPWLGWTCGAVPLLPRRARRTCARAPASPATRSTAAMPNTRWPTPATAFPSAAGYGDAEAAPLLCAGLIGYRCAAHGRRCRTPRHLRLRRGGAHRRPGRAVPGPAGVRLHPAGRYGGAGVRAASGCRLGRRCRRDAARGARRGASSSRRSARWCRRRCGRSGRAASSSAAAFT